MSTRAVEAYNIEPPRILLRGGHNHRPIQTGRNAGLRTVLLATRAAAEMANATPLPPPRVDLHDAVLTILAERTSNSAEASLLQLERKIAMAGTSARHDQL